MATAFERIASHTVSSGGSSLVTFSSIPSTYTDLMLKISTKTSFDWLLLEFNDSAGTNYKQQNFRGDGTSVSAQNQINQSAAYATITGQNVTTSVFGNAEIYIYQYKQTSFKKLVGAEGISEANQTAAYQYLTSTEWQVTNEAINKIDISKSNAGNFDEYSTFYLYGISNA